MEESKEKRAIVFDYYKKGYTISETASRGCVKELYVERLFQSWNKRKLELGIVKEFDIPIEINTTPQNFVLLTENQEVLTLARQLNFI